MASSGNFGTWNSLNVGSGGSTSLTVGNTNAVMTGADPRTTGTLGGTISDADGFYFETVATSIGGGALTLGIVNDDRHNQCMAEQIHQRSGSFMWRPYSSGQFFVETSTNTSYGAFANGDILGWFVKDSKLYVKKNDANVVGDVVNVSGGIPITGDFFFPAVSRTVGGGAQTSSILRPDSGSWSYTPPDGFKGLTSKDMNISADIDPAQTDDDIASKQFGVVTWTGNGATGRAITGLGFQPDFIWFKDRTQAFSNRLYDTSRGIASNGGKRLFSNTTGAENDQTSGQDISAVGTDGFTLGASDANYTNYNTDENVAWCWRANGGTTASDSNGSITSTVQANTKSGFSIITYTGTGSNATIGHSLSAKPDFFIVKSRSGGTGRNWAVYHSSQGATKYAELDNNGQFYTSSLRWNDTEPTDSLISLGTTGSVNASSENFVCYAWHNVEGFQKFGSYVGNGNDDGSYIHLGFRARYFFLKEASANDDWVAYDTARSTFNPTQKVLRYDTNAAEFDGSGRAVDVLSNGLKIRTSNGTINTSGNTYIFGAWGDVPFKYNNTF